LDWAHFRRGNDRSIIDNTFSNAVLHALGSGWVVFVRACGQIVDTSINQSVNQSVNQSIMSACILQKKQGYLVTVCFNGTTES